MSNFFVNVQDGRVATRRQLGDAALADEAGAPVRPWHEIQGPRDASTMWYAVLRKRDRGIFIGMLCLRHTGRQASLEARGWEEVPVAAIGVEGSARRGAAAAPSPLPGGGSPGAGGAQPPR
ncbi:MAG: hypothetical protein M3N16_02380 [Actinomycetota bacterium]|nr:hypothetical protein [Actinomycetota bacterium]